MRGRKIELPEPAMRNLQLLAQLEHLTPERLLEQLIFAFLEIRSDYADEIERSILPAVSEARAPSTEPESPASGGPRPQRGGGARVIDLDSCRAGRKPRQGPRPAWPGLRTISTDLTARCASLRQRAKQVREKAVAARALARQAVTDASLARKIVGRIESAGHR